MKKLFNKFLNFLSKFLTNILIGQEKHTYKFEDFLGKHNFKDLAKSCEEAVRASQESVYERKVQNAKRYKEKFRQKYGNAVDRDDFFTKATILNEAANYDRSESSSNSSSSNSSGSDD